MYVLCNKEFNGTFNDVAARVALDTRERIVRTNTPLDTLRRPVDRFSGQFTSKSILTTPREGRGGVLRTQRF